VYEWTHWLCLLVRPEMKIISFTERHQREVIQKILRHCTLWEETSVHALPVTGAGRLAEEGLGQR